MKLNKLRLADVRLDGAQPVSACDLTWRPFRSLTAAKATLDYKEQHDPRDLEPKHDEGPRDLTRALSIGECTSSSQDNAHWAIQRIGRFNSTGGGESPRFLLQFHGVGGLQAAAISQTAARLNGHRVRFVDSVGQTIPYPPLDVHHLHAGPSVTSAIGASFGDDLYPECHPKDFCINLGSAIAIGSSACEECLGAVTPHHVAALERPLTLAAQLNDVRPRASPALGWWLEVALRFASPSAATPSAATPSPATPSPALNAATVATASPTNASVHVVANPTAPNLMNLMYLMPTDVPSFYFYAARLPFGGHLLFVDSLRPEIELGTAASASSSGPQHLRRARDLSTCARDLSICATAAAHVASSTLGASSAPARRAHHAQPRLRGAPGAARLGHGQRAPAPRRRARLPRAAVALFRLPDARGS